MYTSPTTDIIRKHGLKYHCYAEDSQIYISVDPTQSNVNDTLEQIEASFDFPLDMFWTVYILWH